MSDTLQIDQVYEGRSGPPRRITRLDPPPGAPGGAHNVRVTYRTIRKDGTLGDPRSCWGDAFERWRKR